MKKVLFVFLGVLLTVSVAYAQTGKVTGQVVDAETGEPLPGVNVIILETDLGAATDAEGYYNIIGVSPGAYDIQASFIGYATVTVEGIRVNIDLTTTQNFQLQSQAIAGQEVIVEAAAPVVKPDISANIANVDAVEIEDVPVAGVTEFINLQAGIEPGMQIRGGGLNEVAFVVDGLNTRSGRDFQPFTGISYTSVDQFQIQTGGFNAEYGNVRAGLINIVTKEGPRDRYTANILTRYSPPQKRHFGIAPDHPNSYYMRPHLDDEVAWVGTHSGESPWDAYTRAQYPQFNGWNAASETVMNDDDPSNDMTPEQAQELFLWRTRKDFEPVHPMYEADVSFGGPVPFVSRPLGNLRFFGSYRQTQKPYIVPQMREFYWDQTYQMKVTSNISPNIKLMIDGMLANQYGVNPSDQGTTEILTGEMPNYPWDAHWSTPGIQVTRLGWDNVWAWHTWVPMDITRNRIGAKLTHTLSTSSFYEFTFHRNFDDYFSRPGRERNYEPVRYFGSYGADEAPAGWTAGGGGQDFDPTHEMRLGAHWGSGRDSSNVTTYDARFDLSSQITRWSQLKTGLQFTYYDHNTHHGEWDPYFVHHHNPKYIWDRSLIQGAFYVQDKMEFQGMVANVGVRADYFTTTQEYYNYQDFDRAFSPQYGFYQLDEALETRPVPTQLFLSPRVGISYPITANSKLFFNYGHFRQMLNAQDLVGVRMVHGAQVDQVGNPEHPMPRTVSYELGYEHNLPSQILLRISGYYKSQDDQPRDVWYTSIDGQVNYNIAQPLNYQDIRGVELSLHKSSGRWVRGFANYTYHVEKSGNFGFDHYYQNDFEQRRYEQEYRGYYQSKPIPEPFARLNLTFLTPPEFGPAYGGLNLLGDWRLNILGEYRSGDVFTWTGGAALPGVQNNVRWKDFWMLNMRLAKNFQTGFGRVQLFMDIDNVLNLKYLYWHSAFAGGGVTGRNDFEDYMMSLHLPEEVFAEIDGAPYRMIPGNDRPGDYRKAGVEFQPVEVVDGQPEGEPEALRARAWYYNKENETYHKWEEGSWTQVSQSAVDQMLDNKAYINMPNNVSFTFLNPRQIFLGIRLWF